MTSVEVALGRLLARLREEAGLSQDALAAALVRDQPFVSKVERGLRRVTVTDLLAWLDALGVPLNSIVVDLESLPGNQSSVSLWRGAEDV
jgi:transcriptional regulator with XRE-family HTH domain